MTGRIKTTIQPSKHAHRIAQRLAQVSGMSITGIYVLGMLRLAGEHERVLRHTPKKDELLADLRRAFEEEMQKVEESMD